jgi:UDP-glucose:(heptosyl)LPS alpha-1,3-glucosyltransferase
LNKKIYFIRSSSTHFGGAENYLNRLSNAMKMQKIEHQIIHSRIPKFLPSWLRVLMFNLQLGLTKKNKFYFSLERISCPDIYRAGDGVHRKFLTIEKKSKLNLLHPVYLYLESRCFKNAKYIIANSSMVKSQIIDNYNINPNKINVIYNGIELKQINFSKSFTKLSKEFPIEHSESFLLFVGSGFKRKGVSEFLQIFSQLESKNIKAFIIGKDNNSEYYKNLAKKLNIENQIIFTGPREDVDDFYTISDIFLFPTHYDPFSNVVLEAMNFENVVFTSQSNGASEILDENFIINDSNYSFIISSIDNLLSNKIALNAEKIRNKKKSELFSIEKNLEMTLELMSQIE